MSTVAQELKLASEYMRFGQFKKAATICQNILKQYPQDAGTLHMMGSISRSQGNLQQAIQFYEQSIQFDPGVPDFYHNLAQVCLRLNQVSRALALYQEGLKHNPHAAFLVFQLGQVLTRTGQLQGAKNLFLQILQQHPDYLEVRLALGHLLLNGLQKESQALQVFQQGLNYNPQNPVLHHQMAQLLLKQNHTKEAAKHFKSAARSYNNQGIFLKEEGKIAQAIHYLEQALNIEPDSLPVLVNLGDTLQGVGHLQQAIKLYQKALKQDPKLAKLHDSLSRAFKCQGNILKARHHIEKALRYDPENSAYYSNYIYTLTAIPDFSEKDLFPILQQWEKQVCPPTNVSGDLQSFEPNKRLKIGYFSPDYRQHPVGKILQLFLPHHDPAKVETFAYSQVKIPDFETEILKKYLNYWRSVDHLSDQELYDLIQQDQIDILVDLAGHTGSHRLNVFAMKAAPIQVTALGWVTSTGSSAIDYRLSDPYVTPPEATPFNSEKIVYLKSMLRWFPPPDPIALSSPPIEKNGFITFGSVHNLYKITDQVFDLWCQIMNQIPDSRFHFKARYFEDHETMALWVKRFEEQGISKERLILSKGIPYHQYFDFYHTIDITLDTFPYNGGMTTGDALWMGVPAIVLKKGRKLSYSLLKNMKLDELIADSPREYMEIAVNLAQDQERISHYRQTLRERLEASCICDGPDYARELECFYQMAWRNKNRKSQQGRA